LSFISPTHNQSIQVATENAFTLSEFRKSVNLTQEEVADELDAIAFSAYPTSSAIALQWLPSSDTNPRSKKSKYLYPYTSMVSVYRYPRTGLALQPLPNLIFSTLSGNLA